MPFNAGDRVVGTYQENQYPAPESSYTGTVVQKLEGQKVRCGMCGEIQVYQVKLDNGSSINLPGFQLKLIPLGENTARPLSNLLQESKELLEMDDPLEIAACYVFPSRVSAFGFVNAARKLKYVDFLGEPEDSVGGTWAVPYFSDVEQGPSYGARKVLDKAAQPFHPVSYPSGE